MCIRDSCEDGAVFLPVGDVEVQALEEAATLLSLIHIFLISLVILRFTITFTLEEEYREIGIMKAIGIPARKIRGLYLVKYLAIALAGAKMCIRDSL